MQGFVMCTKTFLAMSASLAVIPAKLWLIEYESALKKKLPNLSVLNENNKEVKKVT